VTTRGALPDEMHQLPRRPRRNHDQVELALLAALTAPATAQETAGEQQALAVFRSNVQLAPVRPRWSPAVVATALAVGLVGMSGAGVAAAYTGSLPDTLQDVAHRTIRAPAVHHAKAVGPDPTGKAAYGLCTAFDKANAHGKAKQKSVAFGNLASAAGGAEKVAAYCATIPQPGATASPHPAGARPPQRTPPARGTRPGHDHGAGSAPRSSGS
jgi:hypothetical protein